MNICGYAGQILYVDLTTGNIRKESLPHEMAEKFMGGWGLNCMLAYDLIKPGMDPLSPENPLILGSGLLVGTNAPGASKLFLTTKMPLNGAVATAASGGGLGHMLKWAGYDCLVITGQSDKPVYLDINNDRIEICNASQLWGKDIFETTDLLHHSHDPQSSIMAIGQGGENLSNLSFAYVDKIASLGKGGAGAIMGSKKLKALVIKGTKGITVADAKNLKKLTSTMIEGIKNYPHREKWMKLSTMYSWDSFPNISIPVKYGTDFSAPGEANELYGVGVLNKVRKASVACISCPIACKKVVEAKDGEFKGLETYVSHYDGAAVSWGVAFDLKDYSKGIKLTDLANRYGIEEMAASDIINFAIHLQDHGIITSGDTGGMPLKRDFNTAETLLKQIAYKEGLGAVLSDGYQAVVDAFGKDAETHAVRIKNSYVVFDPRMNFGTEAFTQIVNTRGGAHSVPALSPTSFVPGRPVEQLKRHCDKIGVPDGAQKRIFDDPCKLNIARFTKYIEDRFSVFNIFGICSRHAISMNYDSETLAKLYTFTTGIEMCPEDLSEKGEMVWNLDKLLNARESFDRSHDHIPKKWLESLKVGEMEIVLMDYYKQKKLNEKDMTKLLDDYYEERGWDKRTSLPLRETLVKLGIDDPDIGDIVD